MDPVNVIGATSFPSWTSEQQPSGRGEALSFGPNEQPLAQSRTSTPMKDPFLMVLILAAIWAVARIAVFRKRTQRKTMRKTTERNADLLTS